MDSLQRILPLASIITSEKSTKDPKHQNKKRYHLTTLNEQEKEVSEQIDKDNVQTVALNDKSTKVERRTGQDRRHNANSRGRWLESRNKKDRRTHVVISMKI